MGEVEGLWSCVEATVAGKPLLSTTTDLLRLTLTKETAAVAAEPHRRNGGSPRIRTEM